MRTNKIILGIDPGTLVMGYGLIKIEKNSPVLLDMGVLKPSSTTDPYKKLQQIYNTICGLIIKYKPTDFAIEAPFFGKNVQSMLKLGRAQGVAIAAAMRHGLDVTEYSPKKVKQAVTGNGNADKDRVMHMLQHMLKFTETPKHLDATDALAVAVCHFMQTGKPVLTTQSVTKTKSAKKTTNSSWDTFVKENPGRVTTKK